MAKYSSEMTEKICTALRERKGRINACKEVGIAYQTFQNWMEDKSKSEFCEAIKTTEGNIINLRVHELKRKRPKRKDRNLNGCIYLIKCGDFNFYKIGKTKGDPLARMREIQGNNPFLIKMIFSIHHEFAFDLEHYLHRIFGSKQIRGGAGREWFLLNDEDIKEIKKISQDYGKAKQIQQ